jgi:hypothetical protein
VNDGLTKPPRDRVLQRWRITYAGRSVVPRSDTADTPMKYQANWLTFGRAEFSHAPGWRNCSMSARSMLARSDTSGISRMSLFRSVWIRPPRDNPAHTDNAGLVGLSESSQTRIGRQRGRLALARSDTAGIAVPNAPPPRSTLSPPPREDIGAATIIYNGRRTVLRPWSTPPIRNDMHDIVYSRMLWKLPGSSPPIRDDDGAQLTARYEHGSTVPV